MAYSTTVKKTTLPNGIRVLSESVPYVDSASVGVWVNVGSRHEHGKDKGISHFIEHMLFKGTERRSARQIADEMDTIGGHLNAFTDKETTWFYAKVLSEHLTVAVDIISDMMLNSVFDPVELDRERNVILEEIKRHEDTPDDLVHDLFAQTLWHGHPLGNSVIGTRKSVESFAHDDLIEYLGKNYTPDSIIVSAAGNLEHDYLVDLVANHYGKMEGHQKSRQNLPATSSGDTRFSSKRTEQVHFCIGAQGFPQQNDEKYTLAVLDAALGGGMSSRLFQEIRENRGLVYTIGSYSASYREAGMFTVYAGTSPSNVELVIDLVKKEFETVKTTRVDEVELLRAKNQIRGALVLGQESMSNRMSRMANSELYFGRNIPLQEVIDAVMGVTAEDVQRVANELLVDGRIALAVVGPLKRARKKEAA
ncbi:MAG: insulinase family protein [Armatimonadetes bacterium]|nr:insulinase family protein [Armatimonadota bacterium]